MRGYGLNEGFGVLGGSWAGKGRGESKENGRPRAGCGWMIFGWRGMWPWGDQLVPEMAEKVMWKKSQMENGRRKERKNPCHAHNTRGDATTVARVRK